MHATNGKLKLLSKLLDKIKWCRSQQTFAFKYNNSKNSFTTFKVVPELLKFIYGFTARHDAYKTTEIFLANNC
jgi:hypothetical protein